MSPRTRGPRARQGGTLRRGRSVAGALALVVAPLLLSACSSSASIENFLEDRYQEQPSSNNARQYRTSLPVSSVDRAIRSQLEPVDSIQSNTGSFFRFDDQQYVSVVPAGGGSTIAFGPRTSQASDDYDDNGGTAAAVRGGGPGEGK